MLKNKFTITFVLWLAILLVGLISVSCSSDGEKSGDGLPSDMCADFATFENTSGNGSVFTLRKSGDSELITLTAPARSSPKPALSYITRLQAAKCPMKAVLSISMV